MMMMLFYFSIECLKEVFKCNFFCTFLIGFNFIYICNSYQIEVIHRYSTFVLNLRQYRMPSCQSNRETINKHSERTEANKIQFQSIKIVRLFREYIIKLLQMTFNEIRFIRVASLVRFLCIYLCSLVCSSTPFSTLIQFRVVPSILLSYLMPESCLTRKVLHHTTLEYKRENKQKLLHSI